MITGTAYAQSQSTEPASNDSPVATTNTDESIDEPSPVDDPDNDDFANELTKRHQLQQTFTVRRRVNGKIVETTEQSISLENAGPLNPTEAGTTLEQQLKASFDQQALTRQEAFDEATLNFSLGDINSDGLLTETEFARLLDVMAADFQQTATQNDDTADERRRRFIQELTGEQEDVTKLSYSELVSSPSADQVTEPNKVNFRLLYLKLFDGADQNTDGILMDKELSNFRSNFRVR